MFPKLYFINCMCSSGAHLQSVGVLTPGMDVRNLAPSIQTNSVKNTWHDNSIYFFYKDNGARHLLKISKKSVSFEISKALFSVFIYFCFLWRTKLCFLKSLGIYIPRMGAGRCYSLCNRGLQGLARTYVVSDNLCM